MWPGNWAEPPDAVLQSVASFFESRVQRRLLDIGIKIWWSGQSLMLPPLPPPPWKAKYSPPDNVLENDEARDGAIAEHLRQIFRAHKKDKVRLHELRGKNWGLKLGTLMPKGQMTSWLASHSAEFDFTLDSQGKLDEVIWRAHGEAAAPAGQPLVSLPSSGAAETSVPPSGYDWSTRRCISFSGDEVDLEQTHSAKAASSMTDLQQPWASAGSGGDAEQLETRSSELAKPPDLIGHGTAT